MLRFVTDLQFSKSNIMKSFITMIWSFINSKIHTANVQKEVMINPVRENQLSVNNWTSLSYVQMSNNAISFTLLPPILYPKKKDCKV